MQLLERIPAETSGGIHKYIFGRIHGEISGRIPKKLFEEFLEELRDFR